MKIGCVIMAAGAARRFGSDKLLAPLAGRPLLSHTLKSIPGERFERIVAVTRGESVSALCREAGISVCSYDGGPQSETVRLGIGEMSGMDGCLFLPGDQPLCTRRSIEAMLLEFERHRSSVIRLAYEGRAGSPALIPESLFGRLLALTGEQGGMSAVREAGTDVRLVEASAPQELWDVDTPRALFAAEAYLKGAESAKELRLFI